MLSQSGTVVFRVTNVTAGDSVIINFNGSYVNYGIVASDSTALNITVTDYNQGIYDVTAITYDLAENLGTVSEELTDFTIDTTIPTKPNVPDLQSGSDSGTDDSDNITSDYSPTFDITGLTATDSVYLYINDDIALRDVVSSGTSISLTSPNQPNSIYTISVKAIDKAGNLSLKSNEISVTIDTISPSQPNAVDLISTDDSGFNDDDDYTNVVLPSFDLTGLTAATPVDSLRLFVNGVISHAAYMSQVSRDTFQLGNVLTDGTHSVTLIAIDAAGNTSQASAAFPIAIDLLAPSAPSGVDLKDDSDTGTSNSDDLTRDLTPEFTFSNVTAGDSVFAVGTWLPTASEIICGRGLSSGVTIDIATTVPLWDNTGVSITGYAMDLAGNISDTSNALAIITDNSPAVKETCILLYNGLFAISLATISDPKYKYSESPPVNPEKSNLTVV